MGAFAVASTPILTPAKSAPHFRHPNHPFHASHSPLVTSHYLSFPQKLLKSPPLSKGASFQPVTPQSASRFHGFFFGVDFEDCCFAACSASSTASRNLPTATMPGAFRPSFATYLQIGAPSLPAENTSNTSSLPPTATPGAGAAFIG